MSAKRLSYRIAFAVSIDALALALQLHSRPVSVSADAFCVRLVTRGNALRPVDGLPDHGIPYSTQARYRIFADNVDALVEKTSQEGPDDLVAKILESWDDHLGESVAVSRDFMERRVYIDVEYDAVGLALGAEFPIVGGRILDSGDLLLVMDFDAESRTDVGFLGERIGVTPVLSPLSRIEEFGARYDLPRVGRYVSRIKRGTNR